MKRVPMLQKERDDDDMSFDELEKDFCLFPKDIVDKNSNALERDDDDQLADELETN